MSETNVKPAIIEREFSASIQTVYEAWTMQEHLCQWQIPNEHIACEYLKADIRSGGSALHKMIMPNGNEMWLLTQYHELTPFTTIVFTQYNSNEQGDILPPPMPNWPKEIRATVTLSEVESGTKMEFIWQPLNPTAAEAEAWEASREQLSGGWGGSFDILAAYLAN